MRVVNIAGVMIYFGIDYDMNPGTGLNFQANEAMNTPQLLAKATLQKDTGRRRNLRKGHLPEKVEHTAHPT